MGISTLSQAVVTKPGFAPRGVVLVYDPAVEHVGTLLGGLDEGCVAVPAGARDIYQTLARLLQSATVHTIHLLGHGAPGGIFFENAFINGTVWDEIARDAALDVAPSTVQTINFWSCETGRGEIGMKFLKQVADSTGATVHGSDGKVGSAERGGSWELDRHAAPRPPFSGESLDGFVGTLSHSDDKGVMITDGHTDSITTTLDWALPASAPFSFNPNTGADHVNITSYLDPNKPNTLTLTEPGWGPNFGSSNATLVITTGGDTYSDDHAETIVAWDQRSTGGEVEVSFVPAPGVTYHAVIFAEGEVISYGLHISNPANSNHDPSADDDTQTMPEDGGALSIALSVSDPDGDALTVGGITTSQGGTAVLGGDGQSIQYTPAPDFNGIEQISYSVTDGNGGSNSATISVSVTPVNDAPEGTAIAVLTDGVSGEAYNLTISDLVSGFSDPDGDTLGVSNVSPSTGTATVDVAGGTIQVVPDADYDGTVTLTYDVVDGNGGSVAASQSFLLQRPPMTIELATQGPITLDQMLELQRNTDTIPEDASITVHDSAAKIAAFFVSDDEDERLSVADADSIVATADGGDLTISQLTSVLTVDDLDLGASVFNVSGSAAEYGAELAANGTATLAQATALTVTDSVTEKVAMSVSEFDALRALVNPGDVDVVDGVSDITGYTGDLTAVNQVTLEAESDGQDLSGVDIDGYDGVLSANISLGGFNNIELGASQIPVQVTGQGSYNISGTGDELSGLISSAVGDTLASLDGASGLILQDGDLTIPVTAYADYHGKIDSGDHGSLLITGGPAEFDGYNKAREFAPETYPAFPDAASVTATLTAIESLVGLDLGGVDRINLGGTDGSQLTVDQAGLVVPGSGTYSVLDSVAEIDGEVTDTDAGVLDDATNVSTTDGVLTLTVAEYGQLADGDTSLDSPYRIVDTAAAIGGQITTDGAVVSLGVLEDAESVATTDGGLTLTVAEAVELVGSFQAPPVYKIIDEAVEVLGGPLSTLAGASSVEATQATVGEALGLLSDPDGIGWTYSIADGQGLSDLTVQEALAVAGSENLGLGDVSIRDDASVISQNGGGEDPLNFAAVQQVTAVAVTSELATLDGLAERADRIDLNGTSPTLSVGQAGLTLIGDGGHSIRDSVASIRAELDANGTGMFEAAGHVMVDSEAATYEIQSTIGGQQTYKFNADWQDGLAIRYTDGLESAEVPQIWSTPRGDVMILVDSGRAYEVTLDGADVTSGFMAEDGSTRDILEHVDGGVSFKLPAEAAGQSIRVENVGEYNDPLFFLLVDQSGNVLTHLGAENWNGSEVVVPEAGSHSVLVMESYSYNYSNYSSYYSYNHDSDFMVSAGEVQLLVNNQPVAWGDQAASGDEALKLSASEYGVIGQKLSGAPLEVRDSAENLDGFSAYEAQGADGSVNRLDDVSDFDEDLGSTLLAYSLRLRLRPRLRLRLRLRLPALTQPTRWMFSRSRSIRPIRRCL